MAVIDEDGFEGTWSVSGRVRRACWANSLDVGGFYEVQVRGTVCVGVGAGR